MGRDLYIVGAGGFARETAQLLAVCDPASARPLRLLGFLDDDPALLGRSVDGVPVLGASAVVHHSSEIQAVLCVGNPRDPLARMRLARRLDLPAERYATVVHPSVSLSADSRVGPGSVLLAQSVLTATVRVGSHVAVMPRVVLTHDDVVEDYVTLASGVLLGGGVRVEHGAYIGAGAMVREHVTVGAGSVVGMGSVVLRDVPAGEVWAGNPARRLREVASPADRVPLASASVSASASASGSASGSLSGSGGWE